MTRHEAPNHWHRAVQAQPTVTREQAEAVLALVEKQFAWHLHGVTHPDDRPRIVEGYIPNTPYAIVWESCSPTYWAESFPEGGLDDDVWQLASQAMDADSAKRMAGREAVELPPGIHVEAIESFSIGIYPA